MSRIDPTWLRLYVVVDPEFCVLPPEEVVEACVDAGVRTIQIRDKLRALTMPRWSQLRETCRGRAYFIVNDFADLAIELDADGVHVGPNDESANSIRARNENLIVGVSCGSIEQIENAKNAGADYVGVGALFEARSVKPNASAPRGVSIIEDAASIGIPMVGIGGITAENAGVVWEGGADGVAVIRAVCGSREPGVAARQFLELNAKATG